MVRALLNCSKTNTRKERWLHQMKKLRRIKCSKYQNCRMYGNKNRDSAKVMLLDGVKG